MTRVDVTEKIRFYCDKWDESTKNNFDSLIVAAHFFDYEVRSFSNGFARENPNNWTVSFRKDQKLVFSVSFSLKDTNVLEFVVFEEKISHHYSKRYNDAINYAKTLL